MNFTEELKLSTVVQTLMGIMGIVLVFKKLMYSKLLHSVMCADSQISPVWLSNVAQMVGSGRRIHLFRAFSAESGEIRQTKTPQAAFIPRSYIQLVCDPT